MLVALIAKLRPDLIVIDTLARSFPGLRENEADDMGNVTYLRIIAGDQSGIVDYDDVVKKINDRY